MPRKAENLLAAIQGLEHVVDGNTGQGQEQGATLDPALATLEKAVRQHADALRLPDGLIGPMDRPRIPSPGLDRRTQELREELTHILADIQGLRTRASVQGQVPAVSGGPGNLAGALPVAPEAGAVADHAVLIQRARQLSQALEEFENKEADVILEAVNTDVGAGD
jgi:hypothetical protein